MTPAVPSADRLAGSAPSLHLFFSVGEPSGDLHGANLIRELRQLRPDLRCSGYGGPKMLQAGLAQHFDLTSMAVMWFLQVFRHLATFLSLYRRAGAFFDRERVDGVILIDYPGFNWWIARAAKKRGIPVYYYGVPQMWAWAPWRVRKMRRLVDLALCKLPFEASWFARRGVRAIDVGHPFYDEVAAQQVDQAFVDERSDPSRPWLVLLPGSRDIELDRNLDTLLGTARRVAASRPTTRIAVACFRERHAVRVERRCTELGLSGIEVHHGRTPELIRVATCCVACSGSVSLELLYLERPTVIVYRIPRWAHLAMRAMVRVRYVTLVNLLWTPVIERRDWSLQDPDQANAEPVPFPEFVTTGDPSERVARRVVGWLSDPESLEGSRRQLRELKRRHVRLGASRRGAEAILENLSARSSRRLTEAGPSETSASATSRRAA